MSSPYHVYDNEIAGLFYLKDDTKIACYLGIDVERVTDVRMHLGKSYEPEAKPEAPAIPLPEPLEKVMAEPVPALEAVRIPPLCPMCGAPTSGRLLIAHIQALVAAYYRIPIRAMTSSQRSREVARARQVAMYLAYELTNKSTPDIGRRFGGRDHTTVLHALKVVQQLLIEDDEIAADIMALRERLSA